MGLCLCYFYNYCSSVDASVCCCLQSDASADQKMQQLGCLMDASHASCAGLYECSAPELDELVKVAKEEGAVGSRLTGEQGGHKAGDVLSCVEASTQEAVTIFIGTGLLLVPMCRWYAICAVQQLHPHPQPWVAVKN